MHIASSILAALLILSSIALAQTAPTGLNPEQKLQFDEATQAFSAERYADALIIFKRLLSESPENALVSKYASEAALNTSDTAFALSTLKPIAEANPNDWQAAVLLVRACAESSQTSCRDSEMARLADLQRQGVTPQRLQQYLVERVKVGEKILEISISLVPWGQYKIWAIGRLKDAEGKISFRATLESADFDQVAFAKTNPVEAAKGIRQFSLDGYQETGVNSNGQRTQTHYTYKFLVGKPSYDTIREEFIKIATGKTAAMSRRKNLIVR